MQVHLARCQSELRADPQRCVVHHERSDAGLVADRVFEEVVQLFERAASPKAEAAQELRRTTYGSWTDACLVIVPFPVRSLGSRRAPDRLREVGEIRVEVELRASPKAVIANVVTDNRIE